MANIRKNKKSAFSLIELSIVLIIIGLLVAGITGGSSLIRSATLRSVMSEARNYSIVVNSFFVQYNALPGDYATDLAGLAGGFKGNGDNKIQFNNLSADVAATAQTKAEGYGAIAMLRQAKMLTTETIAGASTVTTKGSTGPSGTIPQSKLKGSGWIFDHVSKSITPPTGVVSPWTIDGDEQNVVLLVSSFLATETDGSLLASANTKGSLNSEDLASIDGKLDDGASTTGKIKGFGKDVTSNSCITTGELTKYNPLVKTNECVLSYQIDVNS